MKKKITVNIDEDILWVFRNNCQSNGLSEHKMIESLMEDFNKQLIKQLKKLGGCNG